MSCKNPQLGQNAVGYWGRDPRKRFECEQTADKIIGLHIDKLMTNGMPYALWREAASVITNPTRCSCYKVTAKQPDVPCLSCYGTGYLPGYLKFGTRNYWVASIDAGLTFTNVSLDKTNRPYRAQLNTGATTGTIETPDYAITVTGKLGLWESSLGAFTRDGGVDSSITCDVSADGGLTWHPLANLEVAAPTSILRFRINFSRTTADVKSPVFEMVRVRFATLWDPMSGRVQEPVIRVITAWQVETEARENIGTRIGTEGMRFWTVPLNFFDPSLSPEVFASRIADDAFVECRYGGETGFRYVLTQFKYSDTLGKFTRQEFELRRVVGKPALPSEPLSGEMVYRVF